MALVRGLRMSSSFEAPPSHALCSLVLQAALEIRSSHHQVAAHLDGVVRRKLRRLVAEGILKRLYRPVVDGNDIPWVAFMNRKLEPFAIHLPRLHKAYARTMTQ